MVAHTGAAPGDAELVARALEGSAWAEAALCRTHARPLVAMLTRLLGSKQDADDLAQDAFVAALGSLSKLRDASAFRAWLFRIATNLARKHLRRRKLERFLGVAPAAREDELELFGSTTVAPDARAELALLQERLLRLPVDLRLAWSLRYVEGYELTEVAALCDCSLATIKRRIDRAATRLDARVQLERSSS